MQVYPNDEEMELDILTGNFAPKKCNICGINYTEYECPECERIAKQIEENNDDIPC